MYYETDELTNYTIKTVLKMTMLIVYIRSKTLVKPPKEATNFQLFDHALQLPRIALNKINTIYNFVDPSLRLKTHQLSS